ncbi:hypothetical protein [Lebetimonas sp. JH292]|nr:hypothetical protein [Lebetimonas sp. JH292]
MKNFDYNKLLDEFKNILKKAGLKFTKQREIIFSTLYKNLFIL